MRILLLSAILATSVFAQHRGGGAPVGRVSAPPATGRAPAPLRPLSPVRPYYPRPVYVPYPVFIGGGYGDTTLHPPPPITATRIQRRWRSSTRIIRRIR